MMWSTVHAAAMYENAVLGIGFVLSIMHTSVVGVSVAVCNVDDSEAEFEDEV